MDYSFGFVGLNIVCKLEVEQTDDATTENHGNDICNPDDVPTKNYTQNSSNDSAFLKTCKETTNQVCDGDDCQDQTYQSAKTKVVSFLCHESYLQKIIIKTQCCKSVSHHNFVIILYYTSKKSVNRYWKFVGNLL